MTNLTPTELVRAALAEDLGAAGDLTTAAVVPADHRSEFLLVARQPGVVSGLELVRETYALLDASVSVEARVGDGSVVKPGEVIAQLSGPSQALLTGERVALNFLGHLSGVATATHEIAQAVAHTTARVACTRKTTPGLRALEKAAVAHGGGVNHRFGLYDAVMIKDNHIAAAGGLAVAVERARASVGHLVKIEVEVDTLEQLEELLALPVLPHARGPVDVVLLDNMSPETLARAVEMVEGRMVTEASGRVTSATAPAIAEAGVDLISVGWVTHSAPTLDIGLDAP